MEAFHFLRPLWFLALIPALWLLIVLWRRQRSGSAWQTVFDQQLLSRLWLESPGKSSRLPLLLLATGWLLAIVILAGPVWERQPEPIWHAQLSRVLILDLSQSMDARDLTPSRLERARFKIMDILDRSREGRTGLVVFAGEPHIVTPLTEDNDTIKNLMTALSTDIMPAPGNFAAPALQMAGELLNLKGVLRGELLLITDGIDDPAATLAQARQLREQGHALSVLGVGTELGGAIMNNGVAEVIRFDAGPLQELARAGGGMFSTLTADDADLNRLLPEITASGEFDSVESSVGGIERWAAAGCWVLPCCLSRRHRRMRWAGRIYGCVPTSRPNNIFNKAMRRQPRSSFATRIGAAWPYMKQEIMKPPRRRLPNPVMLNPVITAAMRLRAPVICNRRLMRIAMSCRRIPVMKTLRPILNCWRNCCRINSNNRKEMINHSLTMTASRIRKIRKVRKMIRATIMKKMPNSSMI